MSKTYLVAFLDIILCMLMVVLLMVNLKDPDNTLTPPGNLFITTTWIDNGNKNDVDIWMASPKMAKPIGYDNKDSNTCNLVRDDLGSAGTAGQGNFENVFCRETPDGEYIINLHAYGISDVPLTVTVSISMMVGGKIVLVFEKQVTLSENKDEITVVRFKIKDGKVVPDSFSYVFKSLYGAQP